MEQKIFKWDFCNLVDNGAFQYYGIELRVQVGKFGPGTKFDYATLSYTKGTLTLGTSEVEYCYRILLMIGELLHAGL
jgi:hypothetical protein